MGKFKPFSDYELRSVIENHKKRIEKDIESFTNDEIMANDLELLAENLYQKYYIEQVIIYDEDVSRRKIEQKQVEILLDPFFYDSDYYDQRKTKKVDGFIFKFFFPFSGDEVLFRCQASTFSFSGFIPIELTDRDMIITIEKTLHDMDKDGAQASVLKEVDNRRTRIQKSIDYANRDVKRFNDNLRAYVLKKLEDRRKKVEVFYSLTESFEIQIEPADDSKVIIPVQRKIMPIEHRFRDEKCYSIDETTYKNILELIRHTASTFERTPDTFRDMKEEPLRDILLASLNSVYKGTASGEAFRNKGKTDICIEQENRAAFVAECKIWKGASSAEKAVDQLDRYLTWRDCKTALILFSRNRDFFKVLDVLEEKLRSMDIIRQLCFEDKNIINCTFASKQNTGQLIKMCVMVFNIS